MEKDAFRSLFAKGVVKRDQQEGPKAAELSTAFLNEVVGGDFQPGFVSSYFSSFSQNGSFGSQHYGSQ